MPNIRFSDVYRFIVVYRREPSDLLNKSEHGRGHVLLVPETNDRSSQEIRVDFTDLDQLPQIIRQCMSDERVA